MQRVPFHLAIGDSGAATVGPGRLYSRVGAGARPSTPTARTNADEIIISADGSDYAGPG